MSREKHDIHPEQGFRHAFDLNLANEDDKDDPGKSEEALPRRWWFCSTAFPLIAGTFGPIANLLSVCSIVQDWRKTLDGQKIDDPKWTLMMNGLSLLMALVANIFLFLNFARRVDYSIAQPITIIFWYLSTTLLVIPIGVISTYPPSSSGGSTYSQSYFYGIISSIVYFIISSLLLLNLLGSSPAFNAYPPSFESLTIPQRTLMLQTILYSLYLALGALLFSSLESWEYVDGIYWADYTLLTIGFGSDFPLTKVVSRALVIPYSVGGIVFVGLVVASVRELVLERGGARVVKRAMVKDRDKFLESPKGRSPKEEHKWRKEEFEKMRGMQHKAERLTRYGALGYSFLAFLVVWIGGALIFWWAESTWTYFDALYFAFIALLTVGYGDFYPTSSAGRPFFVIWSLIAIPTMTILISNMGDTIVWAVKSSSLEVARRTILPEKKMIVSIETETAKPSFTGPLTLRLTREIRRVSRDTSKSPPPQYNWDTWSGWLDLLSEPLPSTATTATHDHGEDNEQVLLTWLADNGPLFSGASEPEWILSRLCRRLEKVVELDDRVNGNRGDTLRKQVT